MLSSQVRYAVCGMFDLAYNAESAPVQLRVIGERQGIPPRYLEQIFQRLRRAGLVTGKRGPGGGYVLAGGGSRVSLREIVEAVEGPIEGSLSDRADDESAGQAEVAAARFGPDFLWDELAGRFAAMLEETTLEDLCKDAARQGIRRPSSDILTYQI
jgi:Rrf2 family iron-sulfur cluster assembly transcriptional regulator